ncbi:beta strand repeat-containing protein [Rudanella lutea]|uniref:beta strand repeat-containing protein n=1 Tax=Rudanella lutea TaxID=451374 RepID=UPI000360EC70|nr:hypothetical protein [Rudanella lutea]
MKKIILTGAALIAFAAVSYAQSNSATLNQNGNSQTAEQTQTGPGHVSTVSQVQGTAPATNTGNFGATEQTATNNTATVNQNNRANSNRARIGQGGGAGNSAIIDQNNGSGNNVGPITGASTEAAVRNGGTGGNWADIQQTGTGNINTYIIQGNATVGGTVQGNKATIATFGDNNGTDQLPGSNAPGNDLGGSTPVSPQVSIEQSGNANNNEATILQGRSGSPVSGNVVRIQQIQNSGGTVLVDQTSNNNYANVRQFGGADAAGDRNVTQVYQSGTGGDNQVEAQALGKGNTQTITQTGQNNQVYIRQEPENTTTFAQAKNDDNETVITQTGTMNRAVMDMRSTNSNATISQTGNENYARYEIIGDANSDTGTPGDNNDLTVTQTRVGSGAGNTQNVFNGRAEGDNNTVTVVQTGEGNRIGGTGSNDFGVNIDGDGNALALTQTGNDNLTNIRIEDGATNALSADNNQVEIKQNNTVNGSGNTVGSTPFGTSGNYGLELRGDFSDVRIYQGQNVPAGGKQNSVNMAIHSDATNVGQKNEVDIEQTGDNNRVGTGGSAYGTTTVDNASARGLYISGNSNQVSITQDGGDETKAKQNGNDKLTVKQQGGVATASAQSNRVLIDQQAGYNEADITQNGSGNFVYGLGGANTFATQQGGTMADPNKLNITQSTGGATGNNAFVGQNGAGNIVNITQSK